MVGFEEIQAAYYMVAATGVLVAAREEGVRALAFMHYLSRKREY
jgi:hypothetical protein